MTGQQRLSDMQVRILGCLVEKEATTPDQYPLTLNALRVACNQKTNRYPVCEYETGQVGHCIRELEDLSLLREVHGARAARYEHCLLKAWDIHLADLAVLCPLMLRGAQTAAEIRMRCARLHQFDDVDDVEYVLERLISRDEPMVVRIGRSAGQKEDRYHHLLAGEPDLTALAPAKASIATRAALEQRVGTLEEDLADLRERVRQLEQGDQ